MDKNILELQKTIEEHPEKIAQLTDVELISLISLYDQQTQEICMKINEKKEIFKKLIEKKIT